MSIKLFYLLPFFFLSSFANNKKDKWINKDELTMLVYFSPTCPVCIYYTNDINKIADSMSVKVLAVIPSKSILTKKEINFYKNNYNPAFTIIYDKRDKYLQTYHAEVTPEFLLLRNDSILYQGAFDDKYLDIGKDRLVVQNHYLYNAIRAITNKSEYQKMTQGVGCIIQPSRKTKK